MTWSNRLGAVGVWRGVNDLDPAMAEAIEELGFGTIWQGAEVRAYYEQGMHIDRGQLALLQVLRGAIWAGLALLIVKSLKGTATVRAVLTGLSFAVLMIIDFETPAMTSGLPALPRPAMRPFLIPTSAL